MGEKIKTAWRNFKKYWLEIDETPVIRKSRFKAFVEKLPLGMSMYVSSILVGISTYSTFPMMFDPVLKDIVTNEVYDFLRVSASVVAGFSFDIIITTTVFSLRKNKFSYATIIAALFTGLAMALDLYLQWHQLWLHGLFIVMSVLYSLHIATTGGLSAEVLEAKIAELEKENSKLAKKRTRKPRVTNQA